MRAIFTTEGLVISFSRNEDFIGVNLLESIIEMYEAQGIDATPIQNVVNAMKDPTTVTIQ